MEDPSLPPRIFLIADWSDEPERAIDGAKMAKDRRRVLMLQKGAEMAPDPAKADQAKHSTDRLDPAITSLPIHRIRLDDEPGVVKGCCDSLMAQRAR